MGCEWDGDDVALPAALGRRFCDIMNVNLS